MKKLYFLLMALCLNTFVAYAQKEYRPFIEEGKVWKVGYFPQGKNEQLQYFYFDGDTIVGEKTCKRMMCRFEANKEFYNGLRSYTAYVGAFYEEDKQVYRAAPHQNWFDRLYDFGAEVDETIEIYDWVKILGPTSSPFTVSRKWEENSEYFKGNCVEVQGLGDLDYIKMVWMEGVGGDTDPYHNISLGDGYYYQLMSCTVGDAVIYNNPDLVDEVSSISSVSPESIDEILYDLTGHPISHPTKGVYIQNGKKVLVNE